MLEEEEEWYIEIGMGLLSLKWQLGLCCVVGNQKP